MAKKVVTKTKKVSEAKIEEEIRSEIPVVGIGASAGGLEVPGEILFHDATRYRSGFCNCSASRS